MKAKGNILFSTIVLVTLISSCTVLSFYPLYTEDILVRNDAIIGKWETVDSLVAQDTLVWEITFDKEQWIKKHNAPYNIGEKKVANKYAYSLFLYRKLTPSKKSEFQLHLIDIEGETFINFYPEA